MLGVWASSWEHDPVGGAEDRESRMRERRALAVRRRRVTVEKLRTALVMQAEGLAMKRLSLRREFPGASRAQIDRRLREWMLDRPLDAPGRPVPWPGPGRR
jgi:Rv0078B-related antitoxin